MNEVNEFCSLIKQLKATYPDMRIGQLIEMVRSQDLFYIPDFILIENLKAFTKSFTSFNNFLLSEDKNENW